MHGLVSLLPSPYYGQVETLWKELADEHGLQGIRVTPYPHFSWQIAQDYDLERLESAIRTIAADTPPIRVRTTGLALFTGFKPVIFIPVVKTKILMDLHARIWRDVQPSTLGLSPYYNPQAWVPHISLAYEDVTPQNLPGVMEKLAFRTFNWEMSIDNIAFIYEPDGEIGDIKFQIQLVGQA